MTPELLAELLTARRARKSVAVVTDLTTGQQHLIGRDDVQDDEVLLNAFRFDKSGVSKSETAERFITIHNPPLRMVITGAVLIAQSLIPMAKAAGYDVWIVDPRGAFASDGRFPDVKLHADWPEDVIPTIGLDQRTAFLALTHDPKIDDPALELALKSSCFYIGALGSKKTHASRLERLRAKGFVDQEITKINGPIGLSIGAVGAAEIAISIMAQVTKALRLGL